MLCYLGVCFFKMLLGSQSFHFFGHLLDHFHKLRGFGRRDPGEMHAIALDTHVFHQVHEQRKFSTGIVITFQVMAFAGMSPGNPNAVRTLSKCGQRELGTHSTGTGYPDDANIGGILHSADAGKICGAIAAPGTKETDNFRFPFRHFLSPLSILILRIILFGG